MAGRGIPFNGDMQREMLQPGCVWVGLRCRSGLHFLSCPQTMDADHSKSPEGLLGVLGHMLSGKSLDLLLAAAAATGKLKSFARKFIK